MCTNESEHNSQAAGATACRVGSFDDAAPFIVHSAETPTPPTSSEMTQQPTNQQHHKTSVLKTYVSLKPAEPCEEEMEIREKKASAVGGRTTLKTTVKITPAEDDNDEDRQRATPVDDEDDGALSDVSDPVGIALDNAERMRRMLSMEQGEFDDEEEEDEASDNEFDHTTKQRLPPVGCSDDQLSSSNSSSSGGTCSGDGGDGGDVDGHQSSPEGARRRYDDSLEDVRASGTSSCSKPKRSLPPIPLDFSKQQQKAFEILAANSYQPYRMVEGRAEQLVAAAEKPRRQLPQIPSSHEGIFCTPAQYF